MKIVKDRTKLNRLFRAYDRAEYELIRERDIRYPAGTKVRSKLGMGFTYTVTEGSLYASQVNTKMGHISWRYLEIVK